MRYILVALALAGVAACTPDGSSLPEATGRGTVAAINAIPTSPEVGFLIEERQNPLAVLNFKDTSAPQAWDDLTYTFHFAAVLPGNATSTRIASQFVDVTANVEYTFLLTGDLASPDVTTWEKSFRQFGDADTVFELRIANASSGIGTVDVYVNPEGVDPVAGEQLATVDLTEITDPVDVESGEYVVTATPAGDPSTVLYESNLTNIPQRQSVLLTLFDGTANDPAPYSARLISSAGGSSGLPDSRFPPAVRFIHAKVDLENIDIYDDEMVTNILVGDVAFGDVTDELPTAVGEIPLTFTPVGNPGMLLYETVFTTFRGVKTNFYIITMDDAVFGTRVVPDRRSIETTARMSLFHAAQNHPSIDLYLVEPDTSIEGDNVFPRLSGLDYGFQSPIASLREDSYDLYITTNGEKTILDGPVRLDLANGDVVEAALLDRVDPNLAEFRILPLP